MNTLYTRILPLALLVFLATPLYAQDGEQPPEVQEPTIIAVAQDAGTFTTLLQALDAAELSAMLEGDGPYTVYAPSDEAFARLPEGTVEEWLKPENREKLATILSYHIVEGPVAASDAASTARTLHGNDLTITTTDEGIVMVNDATVTQADIEASNGVLHVIDTVLMPPADMEKDTGDIEEDIDGDVEEEDIDGDM